MKLLFIIGIINLSGNFGAPCKYESLLCWIFSKLETQSRLAKVNVHKNSVLTNLYIQTTCAAVIVVKIIYNSMSDDFALVMIDNNQLRPIGGW